MEPGNQDRGDALQAANLMDLLRWRATHQPDLPAYIFLADGEREGARLTYGDLDLRARAVAGWLQSMQARGERALLIYPPGPASLDFVVAFFGCLYAGVIAVPVPPINPVQTKRGLQQLEAVANDAQPVLALTTIRILSRVDQLIKLPTLGTMQWHSIDQAIEDQAQEWRRIEIDRQTLAYLQYTSGSTAAPKGVMVSHGNVLHNSEDMDQGWKHNADGVVVSWLPHFHDMGLVYGIILPLYKGIPSVLISPVSFIHRPICWLKAISDYRATHSGGPNFAYHLCTRRITPDQCTTLDLTSWRVAINGAEPVRQETMEQFAQTFEPYGFRFNSFCPGYGLAEATLKVTASPQMEAPISLAVNCDELKQNRVLEARESKDKSSIIVGCGRPTLDTRIAIVNPESLVELAPGEIGEIWVSGSGVTIGYWKQPNETERTFKAAVEGRSEEYFLRTGDLGFLYDGELFVTGRLKDLIIIGGRNHYPQDIEMTVENSHPALRVGCSAAFPVEIDGEENLVVVAELDRQYKAFKPFDVDAMLRSMRRAVAEHHDLRIHSVLILKAGSIPRTSSGKTRRHACKEGFLSGSLPRWGD